MSGGGPVAGWRIDRPAVSLRVFGGLRAERVHPGRDSAATPVHLGGRQERTLLALLAVNRSVPLAGERLVDMLWPDDAPRTAAKIVQVYVGRLRAGLGPDAIDRSGDGYRLTAAVDVATEAFEAAVATGLGAVDRDPLVALDRLDHALAQAEGEPFATEEPLDELRAVSSRLVELRWQAREALIELLLRLRRVGPALAELPGHVAAEPLRESLWVAWMRALAMAGRRTEALATFDVAARTLRAQLGVEPGPALVTLRERIAAGDPVELPALVPPFGRTLPAQPTPFVGRRAALDDLAARLRPGGSRLVTVTGAGGSGKTRLVIEVAGTLADRFDGAVAYVDLAAIREREQLWPAVSSVIRPDAGDANAPGVARALGMSRCLLVLDNPERIRGADGAIAAILRDAPGLQVLVSSRVLVHVTGEEVFDLEPLDRDDAASLFDLRAGAAGAPPEARAVVDAICDRLDRLPLAIELAALQARVLPGSELVRALERRIPVLVGGADDSADRHRTIEATIAWSYDLLPEGARTMFEHLAVFQGGCTVPAAIAVCDATFDDLRTLVDHSLVRRTGDRLVMLDTIHEFAAARLDASGERPRLLDRHADWVLAESAREDREAPPERQYRLLEDDVENVRLAMTTLCAETHTDRALQLATTMWMTWMGQGRITEGDEWFEAAMARLSTGEPPGWALALWGEFARTRGDLDRAEEMKLRAVDLLRVTPSRNSLAATLTDLAQIARMRGDLRLARSRALEALELRRAAGTPDGIVHALETLADIEVDEGNLDVGAAYLDECMAFVATAGRISRSAGHAATYVPLSLARIRLLQRDPVAARPLVADGLDAARQLGLFDAIATGLELGGGCLAADDEPALAARALGAAAAMYAQRGVPDSIARPAGEFDRPVDEALGAERAAEERAAGAAMSTEAIVTLVLERLAAQP